MRRYGRIYENDKPGKKYTGNFRQYDHMQSQDSFSIILFIKEADGSYYLDVIVFFTLYDEKCWEENCNQEFVKGWC